MPAIKCVPPWAMKEILLLFGYRVIAEDEYNWVLSNTQDHLGIAEPGAEENEPLILPKRGELLALDVMMDTLIKAKLDYHTYFALKAKVLGAVDIRAEGAESGDTVN
jgi:hypothetical protein